jgi:hypothetical protein
MVVTTSKLIPVALKKSTSLTMKCTASVHWRIFVSCREIIPQTGEKYSSAAEQNNFLLGIQLDTVLLWIKDFWESQRLIFRFPICLHSVSEILIVYRVYHP